MVRTARVVASTTVVFLALLLNGCTEDGGGGGGQTTTTTTTRGNTTMITECITTPDWSDGKGGRCANHLDESGACINTGSEYNYPELNCCSCGGGVKSSGNPGYPYPFAPEDSSRTAPSPGMELTAALDYLNTQYLDFNADDNSTSPGLLVSSFSDYDDFYNNVYCHPFNNPQGRTNCWKGNVDCRISTSLLNHKIMKFQNGPPSPFPQRHVGVILNTTAVGETSARCGTLYDGTSDFKLMGGCGASPSGTRDCTDKKAAYWNLCGDDNHVCTPDDGEVKRQWCDIYGGSLKVPTGNMEQDQCIFPSTAIEFSRGVTEWRKRENNFHFLAKTREANQGGTCFGLGGTDGKVPCIQVYTEVVVDLRLLTQEIWKDPAKNVIAFFYTCWDGDYPAACDATNSGGKESAEKMRDQFCTKNKLEPPCGVSVVYMDTIEHHAEGPFFAQHPTAMVHKERKALKERKSALLQELKNLEPDSD